MATPTLPPKCRLEEVVDRLESYDPACPVYIKKGLKRLTLATSCQPLPPPEWTPQRATAHARKQGLERLVTLRELEDLMVDLSLKKTHFDSRDFLEALHYYLKKGKFMPVAQPY